MENYVGIDLSKRTFEAVRLQDGLKPEWFNEKTAESGLEKLIHWLQPHDVVVIEAGSQAFRIAKRIKNQVGCEVVMLNPGDVALIYRSLKKTDKEDALKLARLVQRNPIEELPTVKIASDEEEYMRSLSTEQGHWAKMSTINRNRLHSVFTSAGLTEITKKHLFTHKSRTSAIALLPEIYLVRAQRLLQTLQQIGEMKKAVKEEIRVVLKKNIGYSTLIMSMPGIGPIATLALLAYIGDGQRFSSAKQVSHYVGLVPKVSCSGDKVHLGRIIRTGCGPIRRVIVQNAWTLIRTKQAGDLKPFFERLKAKKGSKKAIVAVARKMVERIYLMLKNGELYRTMTEEVLTKKLKTYGRWIFDIGRHCGSFLLPFVL